MIHSYTIHGMTSGVCAATVQRLLLGVTGVIGIQINLVHHEASIGAVQDVQLSALQSALTGTQFRISEQMVEHTAL
jgi:copper chaperone CopZ